MPKGNITYKTIRGKKYAYLQWTEDGKQRNRRVKDDEGQTLTEQVRGIKGIDEYIRYGGTMSLCGVNYNQGGMTFAARESTNEYVNSAIASNIQHSLKNYQYGNHFRSLRELFEKNELTSAINRIVEDMNHRFMLSVLTKDFKSSDAHRYEIKEYLHLLDITVDIDVVHLPDLSQKEKRTVITQPGMRYAWRRL